MPPSQNKISLAKNPTLSRQRATINRTAQCARQRRRICNIHDDVATCGQTAHRIPHSHMKSHKPNHNGEGDDECDTEQDGGGRRRGRGQGVTAQASRWAEEADASTQDVVFTGSDGPPLVGDHANAPTGAFGGAP